MMKSARLLALTLFGTAALPVLAGQPLRVRETTDLPAPPAEVWRVAGDFGGLATWHPAVASVEISKGKDNAPGAVRVITTKDGAKLVETLKTWDGRRHQLTYAIDESPLPVSHYVSTFSVAARGKGSRVVWSSHFERAGDGTDEAARQVVSGIYKAGFEGLRARLAR